MRSASLRASGALSRTNALPGGRKVTLKWETVCTGCGVALLPYAEAWRHGFKLLCAVCEDQTLGHFPPAHLRRSRLRPVSRRVQRERGWFQSVYRAVDARSLGWCEVPWCGAVATDHAHLRKPRRSPENHRPELIVHLCRPCHERQGEAQPWSKGKLVVTPLGGAFWFQIVTCANKAAARMPKGIV